MIVLIVIMFLCSNCAQEKKESTGETGTIEQSNSDIKDSLKEPEVDTFDQLEEEAVTLTAKGEQLFNKHCVECHSKSGDGPWPDLRNVTERRRPEWIIEMILDPQGMTEKDPAARQLLIEHEEYQMFTKDLKKEDAEAILEYLKTLK